MTASDGERWLADQWPDPPTPDTPPRPEPEATDDLVAQARAEAQTVGSAFCDTLTERLLTALADALEAERERVAELEAGLRRIRSVSVLSPHAECIARDLLEGRAAGGEG